MFFLIPFPFFKYYVWGFFYDHFSFIRETVRQYEASVTNIDYIIVVNRDSIRLSLRVQWICLGVLFAAVIASFLIWKQITQYRKMKQICSADPEESTEGKLQEIFYKKKAALHVNGNVKLICSEYCESPVTIGVLSPVILFPVRDKDSRMGDELCEYMIVHELVHIKHHDVLIKLTALLVMAIHWFNPFVYLLVDEISCISEMYCDSVVMDGKGEEERSKYGKLLLRFMDKDAPLDKGRFGMGFANFRKKKQCKRRILEMKGTKQYKACVSAIMAAFICVAGSITVFAYDPPITITNESAEAADPAEFYSIKKPALQEKLISDLFAVSGDGTVYDLSCIDENVRAACNHDYSVRVEITKHTKNSSGGCTMKIYDGLKCAKCDAVNYGELLYTATYKPCPH